MDQEAKVEHGLTPAEISDISYCRAQIAMVIMRIEQALPRHRSLSLAITALEDAKHWLRDRTEKPK